MNFPFSKLMRKAIYLFFIFGFISAKSLLLAQVKTDISGRIIDEETLLPLSGVNIVLKGTSAGAVSDSRGYFFLSARTSLPASIRFTMIGYQSEETEIYEKVSSGLHILLKPTSYIGEEIIIKAPVVEVEQKTMKNIVSVELLDALGIKESPSPNFYDALSNLKGVDVIKQSMQFMTVNARGFNSTVNTRFVQIVDGMDNQAPGMNFAIGNIMGASELDVESIEFLPGPSSVRYGGNSLNGLLIINSKDPFKFQGLSMYFKPGVSDVKAGSDAPFQFMGKGLVDMGVRYAKSFNNKFAFKVNASYMKGEDWFADDTTNIRPGSIHYEYDPGHNAINKYGDEVIASLPIGSNRQDIIVSRTGYRDKYLVDNGVFSLKLGGSMHYRINENLTAILQGNYGNATTAYTEDNRTSLSNFKIIQGKAEILSDKFLMRAYATQQQTGHTYDSRFLAVHLNRSWKSDEKWFRDYHNLYTGARHVFGLNPGDHADARAFADGGRLDPGTPEFEQEKNKIINEPDFNKGAQTINNSALYHLESRYNFFDLTDFVDIEVGGNYRFYDLESYGSIYPDSSDNDISFYEYGFYIQLQKNFFEKALSFNLSARYDKSENFTGHFAPRLSALYSLGGTHHFRVSFLTGYRNPSAKEQFAKKDLGTAWLVGGLNGNINTLNIPENSFYAPGVLAFNDAVARDINNEDDPMAPEQAALNNLHILEENIVKEGEIKTLSPEQVFSFEIGYKTKLFNQIFLDAVYYRSTYKNFIGLVDVVKPRTSPTTDLYTASTQINNSSQMDNYYVYTNSQNLIDIQGISTGLKYIAPVGIIFSGNATWSNISQVEDDPLIPGFNTPKFKFNVSIANRRMDKMENNPGFENVGFNLVWRWQSKILWESPFGNGWIEPAGTWDIQVSYRFHNPESIIKMGVSNFFNIDYTTSFGGPQIGSFYYVSFMIENLFNRAN